MTINHWVLYEISHTNMHVWQKDNAPTSIAWYMKHEEVEACVLSRRRGQSSNITNHLYVRVGTSHSPSLAPPTDSDVAEKIKLGRPKASVIFWDFVDEWEGMKRQGWIGAQSYESQLGLKNCRKRVELSFAWLDWKLFNF